MKISGETGSSREDGLESAPDPADDASSRERCKDSQMPTDDSHPLWYADYEDLRQLLVSDEDALVSLENLLSILEFYEHIIETAVTPRSVMPKGVGTIHDGKRVIGYALTELWTSS